MAIVQISRIQHRSGVSENLPQLARGEFGLSVDNRKLYIGNGGDDAPQTENIEVLTQYSDILDTSETYTYSDSQIGITAQTGASALDPIVRTLQNKLDDFANVRDFGAAGDGETDDTAAINRALKQLFASSSIIAARRVLFFPAGEYIVSDTIKIPSFAKLIGAGIDGTIIKSSDTTGPVVRTTDTLQQVGANVGSGGAGRPESFYIEGITFQATEDIDVCLVDQAQSVVFNACKFRGPKTSIPSDTGTTKASVRVESTATYRTRQVSFLNCVLDQSSFLVVADDDIDGLLFDGCLFEKAFKGLKIGEGVTGSAPSILGPRKTKTTNCVFNDIYNSAIHIYDGEGFTSALSYFKDCANGGLGAGNALAHVIRFDVGNCHSIADSFDRSDSDDTETTRRINADVGSIASFAIDEANGVKFGRYIRGYGQTTTLSDNQSIAVTTGISFPDDEDENMIEITYSITRNSSFRQGTLRITHNSSAQVITDDYDETAATGVTFSLSNSSNTTTLLYTSTSTGNDITFNYSIRTMR